MESKQIKILFSDYFEVSEKLLDEYGAFNISLVSDLPLFIDPFLLFNSGKSIYKELHGEIIKYLKFLKYKSVQGNIDAGLISAWYRFKEVRQTWLGFSVVENKGHGLGEKFAVALNENFGRIFKNYGQEQITLGTHLEKLCLVREGVGKDNISDFTTNLIKNYLATYTQLFAKKYIKESKCDTFLVEKTILNYQTESWESIEFYLPKYKNEYVLLNPKDILTKDDVWINKSDLYDDFSRIRYSLKNEELRSQLNNYLLKILGVGKHTKKEENEAIRKTILEFPELIDHYIRYKEEAGEQAVRVSNARVKRSELVYLDRFIQFIELLKNNTNFYQLGDNSYKATLERAKYVKHVIEDCDGYRIFYLNGVLIGKEEDLKILYRMTWFASSFDFNTEVNNGRGPVDVTISKGSKDKSLAEFKLASNPQLKRNLQNQIQIYKKATGAQKTVKMILYFSAKEIVRVEKILKELGIENEESIILIDARRDNKPSASKA